MEQYYSNDSLTAFKTADGILIEEKKKGSLKMLLFIVLLGILMAVGGILAGLFGGMIGLAIAPWFFWGGAAVVAIGIITFILRMVIKVDPKITFNTTKHELSVRGKVIPFADITSISPHEQSMMGKTAVFAFMMVNGKKKSLFSSAVVSPKPHETIDFISELNDLVQKGNLSDAVIDEMNKN